MSTSKHTHWHTKKNVFSELSTICFRFWLPPWTAQDNIYKNVNWEVIMHEVCVFRVKQFQSQHYTNSTLSMLSIPSNVEWRLNFRTILSIILSISTPALCPLSTYIPEEIISLYPFSTVDVNGWQKRWIGRFEVHI